MFQDLDSVYGFGPSWQPQLYDEGMLPSHARFKIGLTSSVPSSGGLGLPNLPALLPNDLPRAGKNAIIGDLRNDRNLIVARMHLAFLKVHIRVLNSLPQGPEADANGSATFTLAEEDRRNTPFHRARRSVRWHYQWIVLNDFLPRIVEPNILADIRANGRRFYQFLDEPFVPIEFSMAAFRFGYSMVRESYNYNRVLADRSLEPTAIMPATLLLLRQCTGLGGDAPIPSNCIIDWRRFFEVDSSRVNGVLSCNDMDAVDRQLAATKEMEAYIHDKFGRPGQGWYHIVSIVP
jgi:hypothetical protein